MTPESPHVASGAIVMQGIGYMLVTRVGDQSTWARVMAEADDDDETPLEKKVRLSFDFLVLLFIPVGGFLCAL